MMDMMGHLESVKRKTITILKEKKYPMLLIIDQLQKGQKKTPGLTQEFRLKLPSDQLDVYSAFTGGKYDNNDHRS